MPADDLFPLPELSNARNVRERNTGYLKDGFAKIEADLRFLMTCFAEVLDDAGESLLARCLPWVSDSKIERGKILTERLCQAYSIAFQLLNIVEENTAAQIRRQREAEVGVAAEHGLWGYHFKKLRTAGISPQKIATILSRIVVEPVLTAHPTEAKRSVVLQHHRQLYLLLVQRENRMWTPLEQKTIRDEIKVELERLWRTGEIYLHKPEISAERQGILYYLREVFPQVVSKLDHRLRQAWSEMGFSPSLIDEPQALPSIKFGTWVGGDRDGHPFVTEKTTEETLRELRTNALLVLQQLLRTLPQKLSLSRHWQPAPHALSTMVNKRIRHLKPEAQSQIRELTEEPWRQFAQLLVEELSGKISEEGQVSLTTARAATFPSALDLEKDLTLLRQSLIEADAARIALADVDPIIRHLRVFGFHLAALDIRQNSKFHDIALNQLLRKAGLISDQELHFTEWSEESRLELLNRELLS
ncbi:MAG: phosphoenolpyruvate carboxylase, partial [Verrucomicrobia bacterium]